jgi:hypothetical protein
MEENILKQIKNEENKCIGSCKRTLLLTKDEIDVIKKALNVYGRLKDIIR